MKRSRTRVLAIAATPVAMAAGLLVMVAPQNAEGAAPAVPVLATGTITFPAGATTGQVLAFALPNQGALTKAVPGSTLSEPMIASANVAGDGSFTLQVDPATVPAGNENSEGTINVQAIAVSGGQQQVFFFPATLATTTAGSTFLSATTARKPATPKLHFNMRAGTTVNTKNDTAKWTNASGRPLPASKLIALNRSQITSAVPKIQTMAASVADGTTDAAAACSIIAGTKYLGRPEHFVNVYTDFNNTSEAHIYEGASADHDLGIAVALSGGNWGASGTSQISRSADAKAYSADRQTPHSYWNKVNYQQYSGCGRTWRQATNFYSILSGDLDGPVPMLWLTNSCDGKDKDDTFDTGSTSAATFGGGVDVGPINVSAHTGYGTSENIHYHFLRHGEIAGNNPLGPINSSKIEVDEFACPL